MKILNFGSLNLDKVYKVAHFVREGETISAQEQNQFLGGKGLNQSVALARAGIFVEHAGAVGRETTEFTRCSRLRAPARRICAFWKR